MSTRTARRLAITAALTALTAAPAEAHEKWFHDTTNTLRPDLLLEPLPLALIALVLAATAAAWLWQRARGGRGLLPGPESFGAAPEHRAALYGLVPAILGVHLAVPLLVAGVQGQLFSVNNALPGGWANLIGLLETGVALALFYGGFARLAAVILAVTWWFGAVILGPVPALENVHVLGFAAFFYLAGRGPIAVDRLLFPRLEPGEQLMRYAIPALRAGVGLSLIVLAFTEKLANIPLALDFLKAYPLNFTAALGVPLSDYTFVVCAGAVELLVGLWIALGIFPREIILVAWLPFNLTLTVFDWTELVGHLPFYGALAVLLVWEPGRANLELFVDGLRRGPLAINRPPSPIRPAGAVPPRPRDRERA